MSENQNNKPSVFVSYQWNSTKLVDDITNKLEDKAVFIRDTSHLKSWDKLQDFMKRIRQEDFVTLFISDDYLKSINCLFEVTELMKDDDWLEKSMPIVFSELGLYQTGSELNYVSYWENEKKSLIEKLQTVEASHAAETYMDLKRIDEILNKIGSFIRAVKSVNNPTEKDALKKIEERLDNSVKQLDQSKQSEHKAANTSTPSPMNQIWIMLVPLVRDLTYYNIIMHDVTQQDKIDSFKKEVETFDTYVEQSCFALSKSDFSAINYIREQLIKFAETAKFVSTTTLNVQDASKRSDGNAVVYYSQQISKAMSQSEALLSNISNEYEKLKKEMLKNV